MGPRASVLPHSEHLYTDESSSIVCDFLTGLCMPEGRGGSVLFMDISAAPHRVPGMGSQYTFAEIIIKIINGKRVISFPLCHY